MPKKIYVGNLPETTTEKQLYDLFSKHGNVSVVKMSNQGYAYVTMTNEEEAKTAIHTLRHTQLDNKTIKVIEAHPIDQDNHIFAYKRFKYRR